MTTGPQSFPVAGREKNDEQEACEAKPVYSVCLVYLVLTENNETAKTK